MNVPDVVYSSKIPIDRLLGTLSGTFVSGSVSPGGAVTTTDAIPTNIPETTLFTGIYSVDGITWYPLENEVKHPDTRGDLFVRGESTAGTFNVKAFNSRDSTAPGAGPAYTILFRIALLAKPDQGNVTPQPIGSDTYFDSRVNYQKISLDDVQDVTAGFVVPLAHNAGGVPKVRSFLEIGGVLKSKGFYSSAQVYMDGTNVTTDYSAYSLAGRLYTRAYYSEQ